MNTINLSNEKDFKYLHVIADMKPNSLIMPIKIIYENKEYIVSEVFDIKKLVVKTGELCYAYYCKINGKIKILYLNRNYRWFVI